MKLTQEERRRVYLAQRAAHQAMLDRLHDAPPRPGAPAPAARRWVARMLAIVTLIGGGLLAFSVLDFHPPTSIEALLPRL